MNTGEITARIQQMRDAADTLGRSAGQIQRCIDTVESEVRALGPDRFMSLGAESFRAEFFRLTPKLHETFETLAAFRDKLHASADDIEVASRASQPGGFA
ncbi:MAG: WXG100 family type VII secretion target [Chloroflexi bacterium]|nr:WXG100 family type VII secretion target [Chloroflexota bacterium]